MGKSPEKDEPIRSAITWGSEDIHNDSNLTDNLILDRGVTHNYENIEKVEQISTSLQTKENSEERSKYLTLKFIQLHILQTGVQGQLMSQEIQHCQQIIV